MTAVIGGLLAAIVGGLLYAFLSWWISWGFLRLLMMIIYSLTVGGAIGVTANKGNIRSPLFNTVLALVCVAVGLWVYWGAYDVARNGMGVAATAWTPQGLRRHAADLFENGSFSMKGKNKVKEWLLVVFWIGEGICITTIVVGLARSDAARPFCETCRRWTDSTSGLMHLAADGKEPAWQEVLGGDLTALATFAPTGKGTSPHVRLDLASCPACLHNNFVTLHCVTIKRDKKGKTKTIERSLIVNGAITDPEAEFLRQFAHQHAVDDGGDDEDGDDDAPVG